MICPRCSVGEISEQSHECLLCGFAPAAGEAGTPSVMIETPVHSDPDAGVRHELEHQFRIEAPLHRGPLSVVYLARDAETDALVALKVIPRLPFLDAGLPERFQREAALAALLDHPHIVPVFRYGTTAALVWCSMELSNGRALGAVLRASEGKPMELRTCLRIVQQVASGLDYAHRRGVAHGNVKASNILVDEGGWAQLMDFGMLRAVGGVPALRAAAWPAGALDYLAPDYFAPRSLVGPSTDQYALAVLVYECLSGRPPFLATSVDDLVQRHHAAPPPILSALRPDVSLHVADAVSRAMSKLPQARFANILDFTAVLSGPAGPTPLTSPPPRQKSPPAPVPPPAAAGPQRPSPSPGAPRRTAPPRTSTAPVLYVEEEGGGRQGPDPAHPLLPLKGRHRAYAVGALLLTIGIGVTWWITTTPAAEPESVQWERLEPLPLSPPPLSPALPPTTGQPSQPVARPPAASAPSKPPPSGVLVVNATPWAELYVDGRLVGNTPVVDLPLPAGPHQLRLVRDGFEPYERRVVVAAGQTLRITNIVLQETKP